MLFTSLDELNVYVATEGDDALDLLIYNVYFNDNDEVKKKCVGFIRQIAKERGVYPASLHGFYTEYVRKNEIDFTVPAFNIRFLPYHSMRRIFSTAIKRETGPFIIEIARSEIEYTGQRPFIYSACILASAVREGYSGPIFMQGDHFQFNRRRFFEDGESETKNIKSLIAEALEAGFLNIDIDASTLVDIEEGVPEAEQELNGKMTAVMTEFIRGMEKEVNISIGGEIGEIGGKNSTPEDLRSFMSVYQREINRRGITPGLSKISIQTGTRHGGFVLPDGSKADIQIDFEVIRKLSKMAREEFGMGGAVQHGASTLPEELFHIFPEVGTLEIHLATEFQNIILDHRVLPEELKREMRSYIFMNFRDKRKGESDEQFYYRYRKYCAKEFNKLLWNLEDELLNPIMDDVGKKVEFYFDSLKVSGKRIEVEKACNEGVITSPFTFYIPEF